MQKVTDLALGHRKLVVLAWVLLAVAGVLTLSSTTSKFTHTFATPGTPGYNANHAIQQRFGIDGNEQPTIAVLHLPAGTDDEHGCRAGRGRADVRRRAASGPSRRRRLRQHR